MVKAPCAQCDQCPLKDAIFVPSKGDPSAKYIIVGEAPGAEETQQGMPFVGRSGKLLAHVLAQAGISESETYVMNVVGCRPPNNRTPTKEEEARCRGRFEAELGACKGTRVLALGMVAKDAFEGETGTWTDWKTKKILSTWHPAYVLRKPSEMKVLQEACNRLTREAESLPELHMVVVEDLVNLRMELDSVPNGTWVSFDLETNQLCWYDTLTRKARTILLLAIAWKDWQLIIDADLLYTSTEAREYLQAFFNRVKACAHNGKFDAIFMAEHWDVRVYVEFDTMLAHYVLDENARHGLKELLQSEFSWPNYEKELDPYLKSRNDEYSKVPFAILAKYAAYDVLGTLRLKKLLYARLCAENMYEKPFTEVIMPASRALTLVERYGIQVSIPALKHWSGVLTKDINEIVTEARMLVQQPDLNLNAPAQVAEVIYVQLGLPRPKGNRVAPNSTSHEAIESLKGHPFIDLLTRYRRIAKMKSSYTDNLLEMVGVDGRVHATFMIHGTETGRLATRNPALQTIPRPSDRYGAIIRSLFTCAPGNKLIVVDYSQAELRVMAALSGDPFLLKVYGEGRDLHTEVAIAMFGPDYTKEQRVMCKMFNFAYAYGGTEYSFAQDAGLPLSKAREFVQRYNENMRGVAEWKATQLQAMKKDGYVATPFGRRRRFPLLTAENIDEARKAAVNMPVQSTASDLTLIAATELVREGVKVVLLVHDSILAEAAESEVEAVAVQIQNKMMEVGTRYLPQVPWKADIDISDTWATPPEG